MSGGRRDWSAARPDEVLIRLFPFRLSFKETSLPGTTDKTTTSVMRSLIAGNDLAPIADETKLFLTMEALKLTILRFYQKANKR